MGDFLIKGFCKLVGRGIAPVNNGADGFRFMSFHFKEGGMRLGLWFTVFLTWLWNVFVESEVDDWKLFVSMKSCILPSYWCIGKTILKILSCSSGQHMSHVNPSSWMLFS